MSLLLILLGFVSVTLARVAVSDQEKLAPKPCCFPKTLQVNFFGAEFFETASPSLVPLIGTYAIKSDEGTAALQVLDGKTRLPVRKEILDYNSKILYNISADGSCVKSPYTEPRPTGCIPATATFDASFEMGIGENSLQANLWNIDTPKLNMQEAISVTGSCIPVQIQRNVKIADGKTHKALSIVHAEIEIVDKDLFTIPDTCKTSDQEATLNLQDLPLPAFMFMNLE